MWYNNKAVERKRTEVTEEKGDGERKVYYIEEKLFEKEIKKVLDKEQEM